jgi:hypothetical protein
MIRPSSQDSKPADPYQTRNQFPESFSVERPTSRALSSSDQWLTLTAWPAWLFPTAKKNVPKSLDYYRTKAEALLAGTNSIVGRNRAITGAYANLFLKNPDLFLWPGMAAYASQQVGVGIAASGGPFGVQEPGIMPDPITAEELLRPFNDTIENLSLFFPNRFRELLIAGNDGVFRDIVPLFLAYLDGGLDAVTALAVDERLKSGFRLIDAGARMRESGLTLAGNEAVWEGNKLLLRYEQEVTLQGLVYDPDRVLWKLASGAVFMRFETGPVPNPARWTYFQEAVPFGDVGEFSKRWQWIGGTMLPMWDSLLNSAPGTVAADMTILKRRGETAKGGGYG